MSDFLSGLYPDALKPPKSRFYDPTAPATPAGYQPPSTPASEPIPAAYQPPGSVTAPNISASPTSPNLTRDIYAPQLNDVTQKLNAAYQAPRPGLARQIFGGIVTGMNPRNPIGGLISGETQRQQTIQPLTQQEDLLSKIIQANRSQALGDAELSNKAASTDYLRAHSDYLGRMADAKETPPPPKQPTNALELFQQDPAKAKQFFEMQQEAKPDKTPNEKEQAISDYLKGHGLPDTPSARDRARSVLATRDRPPKEPKDPELADLSKQIKQEQLDKLQHPKPTVAEQNRADLADNLNENLDKLEEIVNRRPELFGPLAGRLTAGRQFMGSNDPDVAELANIKHQAGMAQISSHGMRSAQGIEGAANALMNFNNGPAGIKSAIKSARDSVKVFKNQVEATKNPGSAPAKTATPANGKDPLGIL